jgi:hypothetical protein
MKETRHQACHLSSSNTQETEEVFDGNFNSSWMLLLYTASRHWLAGKVQSLGLVASRYKSNDVLRNKFRGLSLLANYTDWATTACRRS